MSGKRKQKWHGLTALGLGLLLAGVWPAGAGAADPPETSEGEPMTTGLVILPGGEEIVVELAVTNAQRQRGLMYRDELRAGQGMLLVFSGSGFRSIWMKNVRFPLDLIWLDNSGRVLNFELNVPPCPEEPCPSYQPMRKASAVLELNAGEVEKWGIELGDELLIIPPIS